ncbi:MAG: fructosamine kinase family protein [Woeseiaceae bacterium]
MPDWSSIIKALGKSGVSVVDGPQPRAVAGGDISAAWRLETEERPLFLKTGPASSYDMFAAEAEGLAELAAPGVVRVPGVVGCGVDGDTAFVALEWLEFERPTRDAEIRLGEQLATLHETTRERFGWHRDNTIGLTPQHNEWTDDWVQFFRDQRLGYQLKLAAANGYSGDLQEQGGRLMKRLPVYFEAYDPVPSLLHGDLWGGNWACCDGKPVIFDPAVYFGDRESDLAMTRLFGGFGAGFYEAYEQHAPLAPGHRERCDLYQLYHVLNHVNLFGSAYIGRAHELLRRLLKE